MTLRARLTTYVVCFVLVLVWIYWDRRNGEVVGRAWEERAERSSLAILDRATEADLDEAVGPLGIVLRQQNGCWIAIRYADSHAWPIRSSAVARDSGNGWFTSRVHFCGRFKSYRLCKEQNEPDRCQPDIQAIEQAANLEEARDHLIALGFQRVE